MTEPAMFDSRGCWVCPSDEAVAAAGWTGARLAAFERLRDAAAADAAVAESLAQAQAEQSAAFRRWIAARAEAAAQPRPTAIEIAREAMGRK